MISVITPSVRPEGLLVVQKSLSRQTHKDFEWVVVSPFEYEGADVWLKDPPKKEGDFWQLCKAWNLAYSKAKGELIVNVQDMIWFPPDMLEKFWQHYRDNPRSLVTAVGDQYDSIDSRGVPENAVWQDPRKRSDQGTFYEINFPDMEMAVASVPKQAILDCGGLDEEYDKANGVQEKEMCMRLSHLDYTFWIDQTIEYKAIKHPRLTENWDEYYWKVTAPLFKKHGLEFLEGKRPLNVGYVKS